MRGDVRQSCSWQTEYGITTLSISTYFYLSLLPPLPGLSLSPPPSSISDLFRMVVKNSSNCCWAQIQSGFFLGLSAYCSTVLLLY